MKSLHENVSFVLSYTKKTLCKIGQNSLILYGIDLGLDEKSV